ncbi:hypothetical protein [Mesorhizobium sp. WSM3626]|uniref:hypothetical protein n=1 Tax=Mesorhizobium sp. WSM3626 TaxID=1040987 RepID=UPI0012EC65A4|nr:hypothetical protein [Mesorhizobium sp. WSM3626]
MLFKQKLRADIGRVARNAAIGALALVAAAAGGTADALAAGSTWVATWAASTQPSWQGDFPLPLSCPSTF